MGQRLVVDLIQNNKVVASIYYHWSAYFMSTIEELTRLSKAILRAEASNKDKLLAIMDILEKEQVEYGERHSSGGVRGLPQDLEAAQKMFPNRIFKIENISRNLGIITFTEQGMKDFHDWEEGYAFINLDTHEIRNDVSLDPEPFVFTDAVYETDEDGERYVSYFDSGKIEFNGHKCTIDAFDCTCESVIELNQFIEKEFERYKATLTNR